MTMCHLGSDWELTLHQSPSGLLVRSFSKFHRQPQTKSLCRDKFIRISSQNNLNWEKELEERKDYLIKSSSDVENIDARKVGIKFKPPALVLLYELKDSKQLKKRSMPIRNFTLNSNVKLVADNLKSRHAEKLSTVPNDQIEKMLKLLKDYNRGIDLQTSLKRLEAQDRILNLSGGFEEVVTRFSSEPESGSEVNEEDEEGVPNFGLQLESPAVWRKEHANFWND